MSYPLRLCAPGLTYHTMSRCIEGKNLMKSRKIKDLLISVIAMAQEKYSFELCAYTIIDNHFHFVIRTLDDGPSISRIMQFIKSQMAQRYNRIMNRTGPFWNERFADSIVELSEHPSFYYNDLLWYLAFNAVKKGYVTDPRDYPYSSIRAYLEKDYVSPVPITLHQYYMRLGESFEERVQKLLLYEEHFRKSRSWCG
jgi:REP element-mobilizing transposase RayT